MRLRLWEVKIDLINIKNKIVLLDIAIDNLFKELHKEDRDERQRT